MTPLLGKPLTDYIFVDAADEATAQRLEQQLMQTEITQPAVLTTDLGADPNARRIRRRARTW